MKKQLIIVGIIVLLISIGLSGCTNSDNGGENSKFVGTWKDYPGLGNSFTFLSDGTGLWAGDQMLWEIKNGKLEINPEASETNMTYDYSFSDDYLTLYLIYASRPGVTLTLVKQ